jgi:hypothetical protein
MDVDVNNDGDGATDDDYNNNNDKDGKGNGETESNGCLDNRGLDTCHHRQPAAAHWQEEGRLRPDEDGGREDGPRFGGDTHNNQTDHGEGGW